MSSGSPPLIKLITCGTCGRYFPDEPAVRAHQDLFNKLAEYDPAIGRHDGEPWGGLVIREGEHVGHGDRWVRVVEATEPNLFKVEIAAYRELYLFELVQLANHLTGSSEATIEDVRAFRAAINLGIGEGSEVCLRRHLHERSVKWRDDTVRYLEEVSFVQTVAAMLTP